MLLALIAIAAGAAGGWLSGRRPGRAGLARMPGAWRSPGLVPLGAIALLAGGHGLDGGLGLASTATGYAALIAFAAINGRRPGLALVAVGLLANMAVVVVDRGMPVRDGPPGVQIGGHHHGLSSRDHLAGLADTMRLAPIGETVSPGDLVAAAGGAMAMYFWLEPQIARRKPLSAGAPPS